MPNEGYSIDIDVSGGDSTPVVLAASGGAETLGIAVDVGGEISAIQAEKWAVGKARGVDVPSTDVTYHNNSKYWSAEARRIFENARVINYVVCETAANVATKEVTVDNWELEVGMWACIRFLYTDTSTNVMLNINSTGARFIRYNGRNIWTGFLNNLNTYLVIYDGSYFQVVGMYEAGRAAGANSSKIGINSFANGENVMASGGASMAIGKDTVAGHVGTSAEGQGTKATTPWSHVAGQYNVLEIPLPDDIPDWTGGTSYSIGDIVFYFGQLKICTIPNSDSTFKTTKWDDYEPKYAEIIGNGTGDNARSNARTLDWSGNERLKGDVYVGCGADSSGGSKLVSEAALAAKRGAVSGLASLDSSGKVPASQLPSFVDDVVEYANLAAFPGTGEGGKIYVAQDTGKVYRWASNSYVIISDYVHPSYTARTGKPTADATPGFGGTITVSQVTSDSSGHVSGMTDRTITIPDAVATGSTAGLMSAADKTKLDGIAAGAAAIDDTAGDGDDDVTWSADKLVEEAFCLTTSAISSLPAAITDARITEECVLEDFIPDERIDLGWVTTAGKLVLYGNLPSGTTLPAMKLRVHRIHGLTADARTVTLRQQNSSSENGNYLVAEAKNLIPGVQYSWRLYSVANNEDTYVYGIGSTASYPTASMWFQQVPRSLTDGTVYKVIVSPTLDSSDTTASNTVEFEAAELTPAS